MDISANDLIRDKMEEETLKLQYAKERRRKYIFILVCLILAILCSLWSIVVGTQEISFSDAYRLIIDHLNGRVFDISTDDGFNDHIIWEYRIPRTFTAIFAGAILALAGAVMQSVMKNPLADPYTTGVSSGAVFGVALTTTLGATMGIYLGRWGSIANSILFAMIPVAVIVVMSPFFRKSPSTLILSGVAISYLFSSLTSLLLVTTNAENLAGVYHWEIGHMAELGWDPVWVLLVVLIFGAAVLWPLANKLNLMSLDDKDAKALGLDGRRLRIACLVLLALMAACVIAFTGIIGFVGLVIPHIVRLILGSDNKFILPAAMAFGAFFLLFCDIISRSLDLGATIPIGVVTSFIGAPIFMLLIIMQKKAVW